MCCSAKLKNLSIFAQMTWMPRLICMVLVLGFPAMASGQSGFSVDLLDFSPSTEGLMVVRSPELNPGRFEAMLGADWAYHLMGIEQGPEIPTLWIVEHRLSLRAAVSFTPSSFIRLAAGFTGAPLQEGLRYNRVGALVPMSATMGASWVSAVWAIPGFDDLPLSSAVATTLVLPTATPTGLSGEQRLNVRVAALLAARFWYFRPVVNLGLTTRPRVSFYDFIRDDGLIFRAGCEFGEAGWPLLPALELAGETQLADPFSGEGKVLEGIISLRIPAIAGMEVQAGLGLGILGIGAPAVRGILLIRWVGAQEKRDGKRE
jgi:hypothetical protein